MTEEQLRSILIAGVGNAWLRDDGFGRRGGAAAGGAGPPRGRVGDGRRHRRTRPGLRGDAGLRRARHHRRLPAGRQPGTLLRVEPTKPRCGRDRGRRRDQSPCMDPQTCCASSVLWERGPTGCRDRVRAERGDDMGWGLSDEVRAAVDRAVALVVQTVDELLGDPRRDGGVTRARAVVEQRDRQHRRQARRPTAVAVVNLRVGRLRQVVPDTLEFYFEFVARGSSARERGWSRS